MLTPRRPAAPWLRSHFRCRVRFRFVVSRGVGADMNGCWCVRYGDALAWVEAPSAEAVMRRSLDLHRLGDWTDDLRTLVVFARHAYPDNAGLHDYSRAVLNAGPPSGRRSPTRGTPRARSSERPGLPGRRRGE